MGKLRVIGRGLSIILHGDLHRAEASGSSIIEPFVLEAINVGAASQAVCVWRSEGVSS